LDISNRPPCRFGVIHRECRVRTIEGMEELALLEAFDRGEGAPGLTGR
jgi:hypothetical protein